MMAIPTLQPEEFQFTETGMLLNGDSTVPFTDIEKITGVDSTEVRTSEHDREGVDGGYIDSEFEGKRTIILEGTIYTDVRQLEPYLDGLKENFAPSALPKPFFFGTDTETRVVYGKSQGIKYDKDTGRRTGKVPYQLQVVCEDPRIYTAGADYVATAYLGVQLTTGRGYPKGYTYGYGPPATSNSAVLALGGNRTQPGTLTIYGPILNPRILYDTLSVTMDFSISLSDTDYLIVDLDKKTVKLNGATGRRNTLTLDGNWFLLQKGLNTFRLYGSNGGEDTRLEVAAKPAAWR